MVLWQRVYKTVQNIFNNAKKENKFVLVISFKVLDYEKNLLFLSKEEKKEYILPYQNYLKHEKTKDDLILKLSPNEFICVIPDTLNNLESIEKRIIKQLQYSTSLHKSPIGFGCEIGSATYPIDGYYAKEIIQKALISQKYFAHNSLRKYHKYEKGDLEKAKEEFLIKKEFAKALVENEFYLDYQPIISAKTGEIYSFEALLRWNSSKFSPSTPNIIAIAETQGFIHKIDNWVIEQACKQHAIWKQHLGLELPISINISQSEMSNPKLAKKIETMLSKYHVKKGMIKIEITETALPKYYSSITRKSVSIQDVFSTLVSLQIPVLLDDYGTGHANSLLLNDFPFSGFKIDKIFIKRLFDKDKSTKQLVRQFLEYAKQKKLQVICEGVETKEQYEYLLSIHSEIYLQGWYFYKALSPKEIEDMFLSQNLKIKK